MTDDVARISARTLEMGIDVLIDLGGHTDNTRLGAFARRPAPVQVTWLGYLNTTGLPAMDYRLCDRHAEREGIADALHSERLHRLQHSQWCYAPWYSVDSVAVPHQDRPEALVLGWFNQSQKIGDATLDLWCPIFHEIPDAQLVVLDFAEQRSKRSLMERFARRGIAADRVSLRGRLDIHAYFQTIGNVDLALDSYPYNGATTTLDTLWMGTPVVALAGDRGIARRTYSILQSLGLPELVAATPKEYIELNIRLARDSAWRGSLRASLRQRMTSSPLMDSEAFVRDIERAYHSMWRTWCDSVVG